MNILKHKYNSKAIIAINFQFSAKFGSYPIGYYNLTVSIASVGTLKDGTNTPGDSCP